MSMPHSVLNLPAHSHASSLRPRSGRPHGLQWRSLLVVGLTAVAGTAIAVEQAAAPASADIESGVRVEQLIRDAQRKREAGQITEALADLRAANAVLKKAKGDGHPDSLAILDLAGLLLLENGQCAEAQNPLRKAATLREDLRAAGQSLSPVEEAAALVLLARAQIGTGTFDAADELLVRAIALFEKSVGPGHPSTAAAMERLAEVRFALGDIAAGRAILEQLLERREKLRDGQAAVVSTATALARARGWAGQAASAVDPLAAVIEQQERSVAARQRIPEALRTLADLQLQAEDPEAARATLEQARKADLAITGDGSGPVLLDSLLALRVDALLGDADTAQAACDTLMPAIETLIANDDPRAASVLRIAGELRLAAQGVAPAADMFRRAVELDTKLLGEDHPDRAADEAGLGRCFLAHGDTKSARPLLDHALAVAKRVYGPFHPETLSLLVDCGLAAAQAADLAAASAALTTLVEQGIGYRGEAFESALCSLADAVAALEAKAGQTDRAAAARTALIDLRQRQFGEAHERVADTLVRLGNARQAAGAHADAVPLYERAIVIVERVRSRDAAEVAAILAPLAVSYRALGANEDAELALARGLAIWEATVGPDHPVTVTIIKPLALVRLALKKDAAALPLMTRLLAAYDADPETPPGDTIRLLKKLAQLHEARGDTELARGYLERAVAGEAAAGRPAGEPAAE